MWCRHQETDEVTDDRRQQWTPPEPAPEDTREQGDTNAQYNRQTTALHSHRPLASGCRRGMQLQCNVVWDCSSIYFSHSPLLRRSPRLPSFPVVDHRDGETVGLHRLYHSVDMGFATSLPRDGYRLLTPAREYGGECSCEAGMRSNKEKHTLSRGWSAVQHMMNDERRQSCV